MKYTYALILIMTLAFLVYFAPTATTINFPAIDRMMAVEAKARKNEAEIKSIKDKVDLLEAWAIRHGGKIK